MPCYLTRAILNPDAPESAIRQLIDPADPSAALDAHHRLIWTLFPGKNKARDFLWRADGRGKFLVLSARKPTPLALFKKLESKPFEPILKEGDHLAFALRANATKALRASREENATSEMRRKSTRSRRVDIVMDALHEQKEKDSSNSVSRAAYRMNAAQEAAETWLSSQGKHHGFSVETMVVENYRVHKIRRKKGTMATFGILDMRGTLQVRDGQALTNALPNGFGRAKAYGCGLMLVRRA